MGDRTAKRVAQRFAEFSVEVQELLARASQVGGGIRFLARVVRFFAAHKGIHDVEQTLQESVKPLTVVIPIGRELHEFRDRGYLMAAQRYFAKYLRETEQEELAAIWRQEMEEWVAELFMMAQFVKTPNRATIRAGSSFPDCRTLDTAERTRAMPEPVQAGVSNHVRSRPRGGQL